MKPWDDMAHCSARKLFMCICVYRHTELAISFMGLKSISLHNGYFLDWGWSCFTSFSCNHIYTCSCMHRSATHAYIYQSEEREKFRGLASLYRGFLASYIYFTKRGLYQLQGYLPFSEIQHVLQTNPSFH